MVTNSHPADRAIRPTPLSHEADTAALYGSGLYADDVNLAEQVHAAFVRSPYAHANILDIDISSAAAWPGVVGVLTGADLARQGVGSFPYNSLVNAPDGGPVRAVRMPALADSCVRHVGEPVAIVLAATHADAIDAAELVSVDYEELPPRASPVSHEVDPESVVALYRDGLPAETSAALAQSTHVVNVLVRNQRVAHCPLEPRCALAAFADGRYHLWTGSQSPHLAKEILAEVVGIANKDDLVVESSDIGGGFGLRITPHREEAVLLAAARHLGRPVRWRSDRSEAFISDSQARDQVAEVAIGFDGDYRVTAYRVRAVANIGAYPTQFAIPISTTTGNRVVTGPYLIPLVDLDVRVVTSNTLPVVPYRGAGRPEVIHRVDAAFEAAARALKVEPAWLKQRNLIPSASIPYTNPTGWTYDSGNFPALVAEALLKADWEGFRSREAVSRQGGRLRGRGMCVHMDTTSGISLKEEVTLRWDAVLRTLTIATGVQEMGQKLRPTLAKVAARAMGIDVEQVHFEAGNTARTAYSIGSYGSRSLYLAGSAITEAAGRLAARLASDQPSRLGEYVETASVEAPYNFPNGCYVCEVEIDPETGEIRVDRWMAVDDIGEVHHAQAAVHQVVGGIAQGLGQALLEECSYDADSAQLTTGSFMDYALPRADLMPQVEVHHWHGCPATTNPMGAKGAGESGAIGAPPAVLNAVHDALHRAGVDELPQMPLLAWKVWSSLQRSQAVEGRR